MTLDERIKQFRQRFTRPREWDSERGTLVKLIYDLIDARYARGELDRIRSGTEEERLRAQIERLTDELALRREA